MSSNLEFHKFPKGETCTTTGCRSRHYYIEDGKRVCKGHGHVQEGFTQVAADEDDFNTQGRKTRQKREQIAAVRLVYEGQQAVTLYVQCWQLVLRTQISWLIREQGLPIELETVARDLWALRIRNVRGLGEESGDVAMSAGFSSISGGETDGADDGIGLQMDMRLKKLARDRGLPKLIESLAMCYMAILLLRLPVTIGDLQAWVEKYEMPYFRVIREIPNDMKSRLPARFLGALETRSTLARGRLQKEVLEMIVRFKTNFGVDFPPLNTPLIMFKQVKKLCLPLEIYECSFRLAKVLSLEFQYPNMLARHRLIEYPEIRIISLIVISTKLIQPFDDIVRTPETVTDASALKLDWNEWQGLMTEKVSKGLKLGDEAKVTEGDVFNMSEEKLDDYLNWFQKTWTDDVESKLPRQILDLFPVQAFPPNSEAGIERASSTSENIKHMQRHLEIMKPVSAEDGEYVATINRPGSCYTRWQKIEDLSERERLFMDKAAEQAGVSLDTLVKVVYSLERQLQQVVAEEERSKRDIAYKTEVSKWKSALDDQY